MPGLLKNLLLLLQHINIHVVIPIKIKINIIAKKVQNSVKIVSTVGNGFHQFLF